MNGPRNTSTAGDLLRTISVPTLIPLAVEQLDSWVQIAKDFRYVDAQARLRRHAAKSRRQDSDEYFALLAQAYLEEVGRGLRAPVATLAGSLGRSVNAVREQLRVARNRGLLTSPGRGAGRAS